VTAFIPPTFPRPMPTILHPFFRLLLPLVALLGLARIHAGDATPSTQPASSPMPAPPREKIPVLIIDGQNNHDWPRATALLRDMLVASGRFTVEVSTTPDRAAPPEAWAAWRPDFGRHRVSVSNYNSGHQLDAPRWPAEVEAAFEDYVRGGGGFVAYHAANNAFAAWPAYNEMIGLGWRDKTFGPSLVVSPDRGVVTIPAAQGRGPGHGPEHDFVVTVLNAEHPITHGLPTRWLHPHEQLTHGQHGPAKNLTALHYAYSKDTGENEPMDWTVAYGKGRVYTTMLGHLWAGGPDTALRCAGFQTLFLRGVEWAATGQVTQPLPADFPGPAKANLR
jgi:type 1 glutamine amidotransferase